MKRNQQGGVVTFVVVALSLFLALIAGVWAIREYGPSVTESTESIVADVDEDATNDNGNEDTSSDDEAVSNEPDRSGSDQRDDTNTNGNGNGNGADAGANGSSGSENGATGDDDFAEVVKAPDDENASTTDGTGSVGTTGPSSISTTGPSQIAETGPAETLTAFVAISTMAGVLFAYVRSRLALSL